MTPLTLDKAQRPSYTGGPTKGATPTFRPQAPKTRAFSVGQDSFVSSQGNSSWQTLQDTVNLDKKLRSFSHKNGNKPGGNIVFGRQVLSGQIKKGVGEVVTGAVISASDGPFPAGDVVGAPLIGRGLLRIGAALGITGTLGSTFALAGLRRPSAQEWAHNELKKTGLKKSYRAKLNKVKKHTCDQDEVLTRFGLDWESKDELQTAINKTVNKPFGLMNTITQGLSVTSKDTSTNPEAKQTRGSKVRSHFSVIYTPTKNDIHHHTVVTSNPITETDTNLFNRIFKRTP